MISLEQFEGIAKQLFKNKLIVEELCKLFTPNSEDAFEVRCFCIERKCTGLLFLQLDGHYFVTKFSKTKFTADKSGRVKPDICDLCYTRLPGSKIALIRCVRASDSHTFSWMVCENLSCSLNARELTEESLDSKKMLGENTSTESKIKRLEKHVTNIVNTLKLMPIRCSYE